MAHFLDRIFFTALTVTTAFAITLNSTNSLPLAIFAGLVAPHPLRCITLWVKNRFSGSSLCQKRTRRRRAAETVRYWAVRRDESCRNDILALMKAAYPTSAMQLCFADDAAENSVPVYVLLTLRPVSEDAMADCLRRIRASGCSRAAIATTNELTSEARALATLPDGPAVALIDGDMLAALLTKHPEAVEFKQLPRVRPARPVLTRAHALKLLPAAALLLAIYYLFGMPLYLPSALILVWVILLLLKKRPAPAALF